MKPFATIKANLMTNPDTRANFEAMAEEFDMARQLIEARTRAHLTQLEVAQRMGTTQSVVARLASGKRPPSLRSVQRYAQAEGGRMVVRIEPCAA